MNKHDTKQQRGYTLIEAIVYLIVAMFIVVFAMRTMNNITKSYVKKRSISSLQLNARDAINVMARQVAGAGFKYILKYDAAVTDPGLMYTLYPTRADSADFGYKYADTMRLYFGDSSGIGHAAGVTIGGITNGKNYDSLEVIKLVPNDAGDDIDYLLWLRYAVGGDTLYQISDTLRVDAGTGAAAWVGVVRMALLTEVKHMQLAYSDNSIRWAANPSALADSLGIPTSQGASRIRYVKMGMVVSTSRTVGQENQQRFYTFGDEYGGAPNFDPTVIPESSTKIHRFYEQVVEVPNNGTF